MAHTDVGTLADTITSGVEKNDAAMMASVYAPDAHLLPPNHPRVAGADAVRRFWQEFLDLGVTGLRLETLDLREAGDLAVEEGRYEVLAGPDAVDDGTYVVVYGRTEAGEWRITIDTWNSDRPVPTA